MDVAYRVAQALMAGEPVQTTFLGVSGRDSLGDAGVEIMEVFPGSGAETGGIMAGDLIVAVNGRPVTGIADLAARIRHRVPGDVLDLTVLRGEEELTLTATLLPRSEVMPDQQGEDSPGGGTGERIAVTGGASVFPWWVSYPSRRFAIPTGMRSCYSSR